MPSARKPWGAAKRKSRSKSTGSKGLPRRTFTFNAKLPIGLHVNSKNMEVVVSSTCFYYIIYALLIVYIGLIYIYIYIINVSINIHIHI